MQDTEKHEPQKLSAGRSAEGGTQRVDWCEPHYWRTWAAPSAGPGAAELCSSFRWQWSQGPAGTIFCYRTLDGQASEPTHKSKPGWSDEGGRRLCWSCLCHSGFCRKLKGLLGKLAGEQGINLYPSLLKYCGSASRSAAMPCLLGMGRPCG